MMKENSAAARDAFIQNLRNRFKVTSTTDLTFLKDTKAVIDSIEKTPTNRGKPPSINTLKTYFSLVTSMLRDNSSPELQGALEEYRKRMLHYRDVHDEDAKKQEATEAETKKWNEWDTILKTRESLAEKAKDFRSFQAYLIVCLYTFIKPQRLDYTPMKWVSVAPEYKEGERKYNVCLMTASKATFIFHEYKSEATYGTRQIEAPDDLFKVLQKWKEYNKSEWLLVKLDGETPLAESALGQKIQTIFETETGKPSSVNTLRHAYITHKRGCEMALTEKEKMSAAMAHSSATNELCRRIPKAT